MNVSRQTIFVVFFGLLFSAAVPGAAGYLSGRLEAVRAAERDLRTLEADLLPKGDTTTGRAPVCTIPSRPRRGTGHGEAAAPPHGRPVVPPADRS